MTTLYPLGHPYVNELPDEFEIRHKGIGVVIIPKTFSICFKGLSEPSKPHGMSFDCGVSCTEGRKRPEEGGNLGYAQVAQLRAP